MSGDVRHEYVVLHTSGDKTGSVGIGQMLYTKRYEGKERTWEFVDLKTMETVGTITGLHRCKTTLDALQREAKL